MRDGFTPIKQFLGNTVGHSVKGFTSVGFVVLALAPCTAVFAQSPQEMAAYSAGAQRGGVVLPKDTPIEFLTRSVLSSRTAQDADRIDLVVSRDVMIDNAIAIPRGTQAVGQVWHSKPNNGWGSAGKLEVRLISLIIEGREIPISGSDSREGDDNTAVAVVSALVTLSLPVGFAITGHSAVLPINTPLTGRTDVDVMFGNAEFQPSQISGLAQRWPVPHREPYRGPHDDELQSGAAIHFRSLNGLSSKINEPDDLFELEVVDDVLVNGEIVIPRGSPAVGRVDEVRRKGPFGQRGRLLASLVSLRVNGLVIPMSGPLHAAGDANYGGAAGVALPAGWFVTGTSAYLPAGTMMLGVTTRKVLVRRFDRPENDPRSRAGADRGVAQGGYIMPSPYDYTPAIVELHTSGH